MKFIFFTLIIFLYLSCEKSRNQPKTDCYKQAVNLDKHIETVKSMAREIAENDEEFKVDARIFEKQNCLVICIDSNKCISYNKQFLEPTNWQKVFEDFIENPKSNPNYASSPDIAFIYVTYAYTLRAGQFMLFKEYKYEIDKRYALIRNEFNNYVLSKRNILSEKKYHKPFVELDKKEKFEIIKEFPGRIMFAPAL